MTDHECEPPAESAPGAVWVCPHCHRHWWAAEDKAAASTPAVIAWVAYTDRDYEFYGRQP